MKKVARIACLIAVAILSGTCFADTMYTETLVTSSKADLGGVAGFTFTATLTTGANGTFSLDFLVQNTGFVSGSLSDFSLSLLGGGNASIDANPANSILPAGWTETDNATQSNGNNNPGCSVSNGSGGWLCAQGPALTIGPNGLVDFKFAGTYQGSVYTPFDLKADGSIGGTKLAVSSYMTQSVPEPSGSLLLASGLPGAAFLLRRRSQKKR